MEVAGASTKAAARAPNKPTNLSALSTTVMALPEAAAAGALGAHTGEPLWPLWLTEARRHMIETDAEQTSGGRQMQVAPLFNPNELN